MRDGTVLYRFKRPWKDGTHAVRLTPLAFVERLAALIPSPGPRCMIAWITDPLVIARMVDHRARGSP